MHTWKSHLRAVLHRLARSNAQASVANVQQTLGDVFDAQSVRLLDPQQNPLDPDLPIAELLERPFTAVVSLDLSAPRNGRGDDRHRSLEPSAASRFQAESVAPEQRIPWFIREFDRLEQTHEFMWAGYIVKEMLPRIGVATAEARHFLDELQQEGIVVVEKIHNPKNPQHPASSVRLVRDNEHVRKVLGAKDSAADRPAE